MIKFKDKNSVDGDSIENLKNEVMEKIRGLLLIGVSVSVLSGLTACGGGGGGGGSGVGTTCTDIPGEPDIMGQITYTPATTVVGGSVTMHIPIDGITAYVGAELAGISSGGTVVGASTETLAAGTGYVTVGSLGPQTIDIPLTINPTSAAGSYFPVINLCTVDLNTCQKVPASAGVAVNYASNPLSSSSPLQRFKYFASGAEIIPSISNLPVDSCVDTPVLAVGP